MASEQPMELPSEESEFDEDYNSEQSGSVEDDMEIEEENKKKKKNK